MPKKSASTERNTRREPRKEAREYSKRPIWSGSLSFGLINIPIYLYSGSKDRALQFHLLHKEDYSPVNYKKVCSINGEELSEKDIVKGYEIEKGQYVILTKSDFERADARKISTIEINNFSEARNIDPIYYDKPYFIEADKKAEKAYILLREALKHSGKVGVATYVIREREQLGIVRPLDNMLVLNQLRHQDEIRIPRGLNFPESKTVKNEEMEIANLLIDRLSKPLDISKFKDTYTETLLKIIEDRAKGRPIRHEKGKPPTATQMKDLMRLLRQSLEKSRASG